MTLSWNAVNVCDDVGGKVAGNPMAFGEHRHLTLSMLALSQGCPLPGSGYSIART